LLIQIVNKIKICTIDDSRNTTLRLSQLKPEMQETHGYINRSIQAYTSSPFIFQFSLAVLIKVSKSDCSRNSYTDSLRSRTRIVIAPTVLHEQSIINIFVWYIVSLSTSGNVSNSVRDKTGCWRQYLDLIFILLSINVTFTFYYLLFVNMFRPHTAILRSYSILSRSCNRMLRYNIDNIWI
jgi:hypothetical protein